MAITVQTDVIGKLRGALVGMSKSANYTDIVESKDAVLARFGPVFSKKNIPEISEDEFRSFLLLENNHHWSGLHRQGPRMCANMEKLRDALMTLVNENRDVAERLDTATNMVSGMGKNVASAILLIIQSDSYSVWNIRSEANMKRLDIWPKFDRGESFGNRYVKVNQILLQLRDALQIDLWVLDALWWYLDQEGQPDNGGESNQPNGPSEGIHQFGLERHLHEFLRDNWDHIELGKEWSIYQEPGDEEAGYEYPCDVGRIDLLDRHKTKPRWLVIELKRNQTSDQTVGQLLRYIGWVKQHLAEGDEIVARGYNLSQSG